MSAASPMLLPSYFRATLPSFVPTSSALWDFSLFRHFLWDFWDNRGVGECRPTNYSLDNFFAHFLAPNPQVTYTYFFHSIGRSSKLEANNARDHNELVPPACALRVE